MRALRFIGAACCVLAMSAGGTLSASAAPDPEGSGAVVALGRALPLPAANGRVVAVTVLGVRLRPGKHRMYDVHLRYRLKHGKTYRLDPLREAQLVDSSAQLVFPAAGKWRQPALGKMVLRYGHPRTGWVTYALPTAAGAVRVQVTLDGGTATRTGQWRVTPRL